MSPKAETIPVDHQERAARLVEACRRIREQVGPSGYKRSFGIDLIIPFNLPVVYRP